MEKTTRSAGQKARWAKMSKEERARLAEIHRKDARAWWDTVPEEKRKEHARRAARARWVNSKKQSTTS